MRVPSASTGESPPRTSSFDRRSFTSSRWILARGPSYVTNAIVLPSGDQAASDVGFATSRRWVPSTPTAQSGALVAYGLVRT